MWKYTRFTDTYKLHILFIFFCLFVCLFVWVLWHINLCRLFNAKAIFMKIVLLQTIQFSISTQFNCEKHFYLKAIQFSQGVLIQLIQFSISTGFVYTQLNVKTVLY